MMLYFLDDVFSFCVQSYGFSGRWFSNGYCLCRTVLSKKTIVEKPLLMMVYSQKMITFAPQYSDVWPTKVHLAVLNWECE